MIRYRKLGYVALNVTDVARSTAFYRDVVGLAQVGEAGGAQCLRCDFDHHNIMLFGGPRPGLKRIGFEMASRRDFDALFDLLCAKGLRVAEVPAAESAQVHQGASFRLTEPFTGATFEFYESMREFGGQPYVPTVAKIQRLGHVVLRTPDYADAVAFFTDVLNFQVSDSIEGAVTFMRCFPNPFHHSFGLGNGKARGLHHVNFMVTEVDDIGRAIWRFNGAKVPIVNGPGRHPPSGSMFLYFLDPDGMTLEYSFGMEEFPEVAPRKPRVLEPIRESFDYWGAPTDPRKAAVGEIEGAEAGAASRAGA
ncbi:MAG: VOC family protein [Burkholderiales bacterium]|nr:VOC family protein [Burkholderiales bacterium]